jgi:hypothetical protein
VLCLTSESPVGKTLCSLASCLHLRRRSSLEQPVGFHGCIACDRKGAVNGYVRVVRGKACLQADGRA